MITNGVDIVEIKRFENLKEKFLKIYFTDNELNYINEKGNNIETIAGMYAAKEAVLKSVGVALNKFPLKDIEIIHIEGVPSIILHNKIKEKMKQYHFSLSISHDGLYAIAFVIRY